MPTPKVVYERLTFEDILQVACPCFHEGSFTLAGNISGSCTHGLRALGWCREEYLCEEIAALILMPEQVFRQDLSAIPSLLHQGIEPIRFLSTRYQVEDWAVRFRICLLDEGYLDPYKLDRGHEETKD